MTKIRPNQIQTPGDATKYLDGTGAFTVPAGSGGGSATYERASLTSVGGETTITLDSTYLANSALVWVDTTFLIPGTDFTESGHVLTLTVPNITPGGVFTVYSAYTAATPAAPIFGPTLNTRDTWTRSDNSTNMGTPDTGAAWTIPTSGATFGISSGTGYLSSNTGQAIAVSDAGVATGTIAADITLSTTRTDAGLIINESDDNNYILAVIARNSTTSSAIRLYKRDSGTFTQLGSDYVPSGGFTLGSTYRLSVARTSTTVNVYVGNTLALTQTLTSGEQTKYNANTKHGIRVNYTASGPDGDDRGTRFDNYTMRG